MERFEINILIADDDISHSSILKNFLIAKGYKVELLHNGESTLNAINTGKFNICILDSKLPLKSGLMIAEEVRKENFEIPIILLSEITNVNDIIEGFKLGADDFISKPFNMEELFYRLEAILRRCYHSKFDINKKIFKIGSYIFNYDEHSVTRNNKLTKISTKKSELLKLLCENTNSLLEREIALNTIWLNDTHFNSRSMDVYISKLRKLLSEDRNVKIINIHNMGFKLIIK